MVVVDIEYEDEISVEASPEQAFALVADVYRSGMHFPTVESLTPLDDRGRWRWQLREKGIGPVKIRAAYDAIYVADPAARTVIWTAPDTGYGNMKSSGKWEVVPEADTARMKFHARTIAYIPAPRIMQKLVEVLAREELLRLKRQYVAAIAATLDCVV
jgi:carbon monoxide dehydrogenase subunit G